MSIYISRQPAARARLRTQRGLTLIEFMVSITIGLILVVGLLLLFAGQSSTQSELEKSSRQIENGRYAMHLLREDLQLAGYYGEFYNISSLTVPAILPDPCLTGVTDLGAALPFPVQGYDAPGSVPGGMVNCSLDASNHKPGTDILVVRRAEADGITSNLVAGQAYLQAGLTATKLEIKQVVGVATTTAVDKSVFNLIRKDDSVAPLRKLSVHVYYVSPCSVPANGSTCSSAGTDDGGVSIPTLKRLELSVVGGVSKFIAVPLVEGVENMQIDYGFDTNNDGSPDLYDKDATAVSDWSNVVAARVHLLARNNEQSPDYLDDKVYDLGLAGVTTVTKDKFKRHVFAQTIRLVNPSGRREK